MDSLEDAISETQQTLQQIFSKPKCTDKLLRRPPFRFISDIVRATIASRGFPNKYYKKEEFDCENKDKAAKIAFLEKLVYLVSVCQGMEVHVKVSSIVAGKEVVDTLQLLNSFGKIALDEKFPHDEAVAHCLSGGTIQSFPSFDSVSKDADSFSNDENIHSDFKKTIRDCTGDLTQTKDLLNSVITKPRCSTKLLEKPPFRFIHDVVIAIASAEDMDLTKVLSESEMNSSNVKEKEAKINFLRKLIHHVEKTFSLKLDMNPVRVVGGKDSDKTRKLLQLFVILVKDGRMHSEDYNGHDNLQSFGENTNEHQSDPRAQESIRDDEEVAKEETKSDSSRDIIDHAQMGDDENVGQSMKQVSPSDVKEVIESIGEKLPEVKSYESIDQFIVKDDVQLDGDFESNNAVRPMTAPGRPRTAVQEHVEYQDIIEDLVDTKVPILKARPFLDLEVVPNLNESSSEESEQESSDEEELMTLGRMRRIGSNLRSTEKMSFPQKEIQYSIDNVSSTLQNFAKTASAITAALCYSGIEDFQQELIEQQKVYQEGLQDLQMSKKQTKEIMLPLREELVKLNSDIKIIEEKVRELSQ